MLPFQVATSRKKTEAVQLHDEAQGEIDRLKREFITNGGIIEVVAPGATGIKDSPKKQPKKVAPKQKPKQKQCVKCLETKKIAMYGKKKSVCKVCDALMRRKMNY